MIIIIIHDSPWQIMDDQEGYWVGKYLCLFCTNDTNTIKKQRRCEQQCVFKAQSISACLHLTICSPNALGVGCIIVRLSFNCRLIDRQAKPSVNVNYICQDFVLKCTELETYSEFGRQPRPGLKPRSSDCEANTLPVMPRGPNLLTRSLGVGLIYCNYYMLLLRTNIEFFKMYVFLQLVQARRCQRYCSQHSHRDGMDVQLASAF